MLIVDSTTPRSAADAKLAAAVWAERAARLGADRVFLVQYPTRDGPRSYNWYGARDVADAAARTVLGATVRTVPR